ncbi:MAG TPA: sugar MFS transporter [Candidatus Angelobacter sp.]|nr:sugar MFS transporter [Candidatus Angelobacter sp.]
MASISSTAPAAVSEKTNGQTYRGPFAIMTVLFFMWGFMTVLNDLLNAHFKDVFTLTNFQAALVQSAFFGAFGIGSLIYFIVSMTSGDPINRIGYKNGVVIGLLVCAVGTGLFLPASIMASYPFFLVALFIEGLGVTILQIAANPYVTILGPERTASSRLNLSQAFNSLGTTLAPIVGAHLIFKVFGHGVDSVKIPYICFAIVFVILAIIFKFAHVPSFTNKEHIVRGVGALRHWHTVLGMVAIFMYVGGEVTVGNNVILFLGTPQLGSITRADASQFLAFYWGGLMIGRFMGAFALSDLRKQLKVTFTVLVPAVAFIVVGLLSDWHNAAHYGIFLAVLVVAFFVGGGSPNRMLALFGAIIIALLATGMTTAHETAKWTVLCVGLFCSVMWSNIFSLAIEGLGELKSQASSLLVMAIIGGAALPALQGRLADRIGVQHSFIVPIIAFAYVGFYGLKGYKIGRDRAVAA